MPTDLISKKEKYDEEISRLTLMDDGFSRVVMNKECMQVILSVLKEQPDFMLEEFASQKVFENFAGRGACVDFYGVDTNYKHIILELQNDDEGADLKRPRFLGSMADVQISEKGDKWKDMGDIEIYVIAKNDVIKGGKPIYHIYPFIMEMNEKAEMKISYTIAHTRCVNDAKIGQLMKDLTESCSDKIVNEVLRERVEYFKKGKGKKDMCKIMQEIEERGEKRGEERGEKRGEKRGKEIGMIEGESLLLMNLLKQKLGCLSKNIEMMLKSSTLDQLENLSNHIFEITHENQVADLLTRTH